MSSIYLVVGGHASSLRRASGGVGSSFHHVQRCGRRHTPSSRLSPRTEKSFSTVSNMRSAGRIKDMRPEGIAARQQAQARTVHTRPETCGHVKALRFDIIHIAEDAIDAEVRSFRRTMTHSKHGRLAVGHLGDHFEPGGIAQVKHVGFPVVRVQQADLAQSAGPGAASATGCASACCSSRASSSRR